MQASNANTALHRVKLYKLNETGGWDDKGTGLVSVGPMECANHQSNAVGLVVISEESQKMLMVHRILHEDIYNRQDETIITWTDPDIGTDVALSFQESQGCNAIWQHIVRLQSDADPKHPEHRRRVIDEFDGAVGHIDGDYARHDSGDVGPSGHIELPPPEMANLEEISKILGHVPPMQRERAAQLLMMPGYLRKLLDLFRQCEDLEDTTSLHHLFRLMRSIIMLNDTQLLDELLKEEHVMDVIGCLEYDPDLQAPQEHRNFLQTAVVFKEVVPIISREVLAKIHQTYRIQYIKDVILPRSLDDATYATLSSLMLFNNVDVVLGLNQDVNFLPSLFSALKSKQPGNDGWDDLVAFLQEFCSLAKHLQMQQRHNLWNRMTQLGMFEVIACIMQSSAPPVKLRATDILLSALAHDPTALRSFLATQPGYQLLDCLVTEFVGSEQSGLSEQIAELFKLLADPETMEGSLDKSPFVDVFYNKFMDKLISPVAGADIDASSGSNKAKASTVAAGSSARNSDSVAGSPPAKVAATANAGASTSSSIDCGVPASTIGLIVDLLCFCVQHHSYWAKYHMLRKNVIEKVLRLLRRKERWLVVAAVRFVRTCIGTKDDFYARQICKNQLLDPVMTAFFDNGERYNLLNSAVLEMVEFIRKENIKPLTEYLVKKFGSRFEEVTYVDTFKQLQLKWEQSNEAAAMGPDATGAAGAGIGGKLYSSRRRLRRDDRELDKDEEDYFSEDSVEDHSEDSSGANRNVAAAGAAAGGGVEPRLVIKGLFKPAGAGRGTGGSSSSSVAATGRAAGAAAAEGDGGAAGSSSSGRAAVGAAATAAAAGAGAGAGAGVMMSLVPYGDEDEDSDSEAADIPPATAHKLTDASSTSASAGKKRAVGQRQQQQQEQRLSQQDAVGNGSSSITSRQPGQQSFSTQRKQQSQPLLQQLKQHTQVDCARTSNQLMHQQKQGTVSPISAAAAAAGVDLSPSGDGPTAAAADAASPAATTAAGGTRSGSLTPIKRSSGDGGGGSNAAVHASPGKRPRASSPNRSPQQQQQVLSDAAGSVDMAA